MGLLLLVNCSVVSRLVVCSGLYSMVFILVFL